MQKLDNNKFKDFSRILFNFGHIQAHLDKVGVGGEVVDTWSRETPRWPMNVEHPGLKII